MLGAKKLCEWAETAPGLSWFWRASLLECPSGPPRPSECNLRSKSLTPEVSRVCVAHEPGRCRVGVCDCGKGAGASRCQPGGGLRAGEADLCGCHFTGPQWFASPAGEVAAQWGQPLVGHSAHPAGGSRCRLFWEGGPALFSALWGAVSGLAACPPIPGSPGPPRPSLPAVAGRSRRW